MSKNITEANRRLDQIKKIYEHGTEDGYSQASSCCDELSEIYRKAKREDTVLIRGLLKEAHRLTEEMKKKMSNETTGKCRLKSIRDFTSNSNH